jgi:hypothetical protein
METAVRRRRALITRNVVRARQEGANTSLTDVTLREKIDDRGIRNLVPHCETRLHTSQHYVQRTGEEGAIIAHDAPLYVEVAIHLQAVMVLPADKALQTIDFGGQLGVLVGKDVPRPLSFQLNLTVTNTELCKLLDDIKNERVPAARRNNSIGTIDLEAWVRPRELLARFCFTRLPGGALGARLAMLVYFYKLPPFN